MKSKSCVWRLVLGGVGLLLHLSAWVPGSCGAAALGHAGNHLDLGPGWRTSTVAKPLDRDADNVLGTDGYHLVNLPPLLPPYVSQTAILTSTYPGNSGYAAMDNAVAMPGQFTTGTMNPFPGVGLSADLFQFTLNIGAVNRRIRVGLLVDNLDIAAYNAAGLSLVWTDGPGATSGPVATASAAFNNRMPDWVFFDITGATAGDSFVVRGVGGVNAAATLGGVAFDSDVPAVVTQTNDTGPGSLRAVVAAAAPGTTITFATNLSGHTILLGSGQILLNKNLRIDASPLPGGIQINGLNTTRLFEVASNTTVLLTSLTLTNGRFIYSGDDFNNNRPNGGGGILNQGHLTLDRCSIVGNRVGSAFLGLIEATGGGIMNHVGGTLTANQCTFAGNLAADSSGRGGAIHGGGGAVTLNQCTISANTAAYGGGFYSTNTSGLTMFNCIVAGNSDHSGTNFFGGFTALGNNFFVGDPLLQPLGYYGGSTPTMRPLPGSPAINAGDNAAINVFTFDQRGLARWFGAGVDLGAVETQPLVVINLNDAGPGSLRSAVALAAAGDTITFAIDLSGQSIQLDSTLVLSRSVTLDASALPAGVRILGNGRVMEVSPGQTVALRSLEIRNGYHPQSGAGIYNAGILTLDSCIIANNGANTEGNYAPGAGGGIYNAGTLTLNQCALTGNIANEGAAIYNQSGAGLTLNQCTLTGNEANFGTGGLRNLGSVTVKDTILAGNTTIHGLHPNLINSGLLTVVVTTNADAGIGSLREGLASYPGATDIAFAPQLAGQTITLAGGELVLDSHLTIDAAGLSGGVTIAGVGAGRLLRISSSGDVTLSGLTFSNGNAAAGGALYSAGGSTVRIVRCTFAGNQGQDGGAILSDGNLEVENSTFANNTGVSGGAIQCRAPATLVHCTVSGNTATNGGGIHNQATTLTVVNCIIAGNTAVGAGDDIYSEDAALIFAHANLVQNLVELTPSAPATGPAPLSQAPLLGVLGHYGGPTPTMPPAVGSPAINAGGPTALSIDQRGGPRPLGSGPELGAVELPPFSRVYFPGLQEVSASSVAWGDYDNDGELDLLATGMRTYEENSNETGDTELWRNTGNGFSSAVGNLPAVGRSSVAWGDYDNDGRLDLLISGRSYFFAGIGPVMELELSLAEIWRNTGSGFINMTAGLAPDLPPVHSSSVAWGDYDNDGRLDFLLTGFVHGEGLPKSQLWRNTGSGFTHVTASLAPGLPPVHESSVAWGDYDNDGRLDFILTGRTVGGRVAQIWRNTGSGFINVTAGVAPGLPGLSESSVAWSDYDNDGRLDFILTGYGGFAGVTQIWRNTGSGFIHVTAGVAPGLPQVRLGSVAWGDFDNDGRLDFLLTGTPGLDEEDEPVSQLWWNTGQGFIDVTARVAPGLPGVFRSSVAWGDYNRDGRLDFVLSGATNLFSPDFISSLWRNNTIRTNTPPSAPTGLAMTTASNAVLLSWSAATDAQTPSSGLTYNVRAGTAPGGTNLLTAHVDANAGLRRLPARGNAEQRHFLPLLGLTNGQTVHWSVQAVDTAFAGGAFASETSVATVPTLSVTPTSSTNARVTWTPPTWGWSLQETRSLTPAGWSNSPSGTQNPASVSTTNTATFYRLIQP